MNTVDDITIQRYLDDDMPEAERAEFEARLQQDSTLRERLEDYRLIAVGICRQGDLDAWQRVQQLEAEAEALSDEGEDDSEAYDPEDSNLTKWLFRGMAASVLMVMVGFPFYWQQDELRYARIYEQHFEPYEALGGATRGGNNEGYVLPDAFEAYYVGDYPQAIELFWQASTQEDRPYVWLYLGNAYLSNGQAQEATEALKHVLEYEDVDERTRLRAHWDLGLAYLKLNNEDAATRHFTAIQNTEDYEPDATEILESIH